MRPLIILVLLTSPLFAAPVPKALKKPPSVEGRWHLIEYCPNGKAMSVERMIRDWAVDGEKLIIGKSTLPFTFRDPDRPHLRQSDDQSAVVKLVGDKLHYCYTVSPGRALTECEPGQGIYYYVFERAKE